MPLQSQYSWAQQSPAVPLSCPAQREVQSGEGNVDDVVVCFVVSAGVDVDATVVGVVVTVVEVDVTGGDVDVVVVGVESSHLSG